MTELVLVKHQSGIMLPENQETKPRDKKNRVKSKLLSLRSYNTWRGMKDRCGNPNHSQYKYYGEKGIGICEEWRDYKNFFLDMGEPPDKSYVLDRIDCDKSYSKDNCRWVSPSNSCANRKGWSKHGFKGVIQRVSGSWGCVVNINKKTVSLGVFDSPESAARAYDEYAIKRYGEFAKLNFPIKK